MLTKTRTTPLAVCTPEYETLVLTGFFVMGVAGFEPATSRV